MKLHDETFACMGTSVRLIIAGPSAADAAVAAREYLEAFDRRLSRFRPDSELSRLNGDLRSSVPASPLLRAVVRAGLLAAEASGGLVDPTITDALEAAGYTRSRAGAQPMALEPVLRSAPSARVAGPSRAAAWRNVSVDDETGVIHRPVGLRLDSGGIGKGFAADAVASLLEGQHRFVVDCGGDLRVGGPDAARWPFDVEVAHPMTGRVAHMLRIGWGGVATSGIDRRVWRRADGRYGHHLVDPATGEPAWTGLVSATALAPTALGADILAKAAVLAGPSAARSTLARHGGLVVDDSGTVERIAVPLTMTALRPFMRRAA